MTGRKETMRFDYKGLLYRLKKLDIGSTPGNEAERERQGDVLSLEFLFFRLLVDL